MNIPPNPKKRKGSIGSRTWAFTYKSKGVFDLQQLKNDFRCQAKYGNKSFESCIKLAVIHMETKRVWIKFRNQVHEGPLRKYPFVLQDSLTIQHKRDLFKDSFWLNGSIAFIENGKSLLEASNNNNLKKEEDSFEESLFDTINHMNHKEEESFEEVGVDIPINNAEEKEEHRFLEEPQKIFEEPQEILEELQEIFEQPQERLEDPQERLEETPNYSDVAYLLEEIIPPLVLKQQTLGDMLAGGFKTGNFQKCVMMVRYWDILKAFEGKMREMIVPQKSSTQSFLQQFQGGSDTISTYKEEVPRMMSQQRVRVEIIRSETDDQESLKMVSKKLKIE